MQPLPEIALIVAVLAFFSILSYKKNMLDMAGIAIANLVGLSIYALGNLNYFLIAIVFFVVAEAGTHFSKNGKGEPHKTRTIGNIFGNSGVAVIALAFNAPIAFFGAMAAALADTLSSEIGLLSKKKPVLLTTLQEVEPGTDGGVTVLGMASAAAGASIIALVHYALNQNIVLFAAIVAAGIFGSLVDSYFGAVFERSNLLGNTEVNFLGSGGGALLAFIISLAL